MQPFYKARPFSEWEHDLQHAEHPDARYRALSALLQLGTGESLAAPVRGALTDADASVRALAARSLTRAPLLDEVRGEVPEWSALLGAALQDADPDVRFEAARALVKIGQPTSAAAETLRGFLVDPETSPVMKAAVTEVLGSDPAFVAWALDPVWILLLEPTPEVREAAITAIANWGQGAARAMDDVVTLLDDEEPIVREQAARALGRFGTVTIAASEALQAASEDEDEGVAAMAREALASIRVVDSLD